jgi:hypothetical protein
MTFGGDELYPTIESKATALCFSLVSHDGIQQFLLHLFGESRGGSERGIFIGTDDQGRIIATFKGQMAFPHRMVDDNE